MRYLKLFENELSGKERTAAPVPVAAAVTVVVEHARLRWVSPFEVAAA